MPRCELSGKSPVSKNLVSHSKIKTKSRAHPNIQSKKMLSQALNESTSFKIAASTLRDIEHMGGFDKYLLKQKDELLSKRALSVKNRIRKKLGQASKPPAPKAKKSPIKKSVKKATEAPAKA